jgi:hypothetical protein
VDNVECEEDEGIRDSDRVPTQLDGDDYQVDDEENRVSRDNPPVDASSRLSEQVKTAYYVLSHEVNTLDDKLEEG